VCVRVCVCMCVCGLVCVCVCVCAGGAGGAGEGLQLGEARDLLDGFEQEIELCVRRTSQGPKGCQ